MKEDIVKNEPKTNQKRKKRTKNEPKSNQKRFKYVERADYMIVS